MPGTAGGVFGSLPVPLPAWATVGGPADAAPTKHRLQGHHERHRQRGGMGPPAGRVPPLRRAVLRGDGRSGQSAHEAPAAAAPGPAGRPRGAAGGLCRPPHAAEGDGRAAGRGAGAAGGRPGPRASARPAAGRRGAAAAGAAAGAAAAGACWPEKKERLPRPEIARQHRPAHPVARRQQCPDGKPPGCAAGGAWRRAAALPHAARPARHRRGERAREAGRRRGTCSALACCWSGVAWPA